VCSGKVWSNLKRAFLDLPLFSRLESPKIVPIKISFWIALNFTLDLYSFFSANVAALRLKLLLLVVKRTLKLLKPKVYALKQYSNL